MVGLRGLHWALFPTYWAVRSHVDLGRFLLLWCWSLGLRPDSQALELCLDVFSTYAKHPGGASDPPMTL
jgi:hypothetical protein